MLLLSDTSMSFLVLIHFIHCYLYDISACFCDMVISASNASMSKYLNKYIFFITYDKIQMLRKQTTKDHFEKRHFREHSRNKQR